MNTLNSNNWFASRPLFREFEIEGHVFAAVSLSEEAKELISSCESYAEMLDTAADYGLACNRVRVCEDEDKKQDIELFWSLDEFDTDDEPTIKEQFGEKVCEISGIAEAVGKQALSEGVETIDDDDIAEQVGRHPSSIA